MKYDYLIVGAGLYGSVFAHECIKANKTVLVIDKRHHIGGNCYTETIENINVHAYGPHIFHTDDKAIWDYINQFAEFNNFICRAKARYKDEIYSFPINLLTLHQLWGVTTPSEAAAKIAEVRYDIPNPQNLEEQVLSQIGKEVYEKFIYGYTKKQWGREPRDLPASIIKRLQMRLSFDDNYFPHRYQGVPIGGWTPLFEKLLQGAEVRLNCEFEHYMLNIAETVIYTGGIDEFYKFHYGNLDYRSLRFEHKTLDGDFQGVHGVNYTEYEVPYTRITEHKHFENPNNPKTVITYEYPENYTIGKEAYYPINDEKNNAMYELYKQSPSQNVIFGGRLGLYSYMDMHQVVAEALRLSVKLL